MSDKTVNEIILNKELGDFPLFKALKLDQYFPSGIFKSTIDALVLKYDFNTTEELGSLKGKVSNETYDKIKENVFRKLELDLKNLKDSI